MVAVKAVITPMLHRSLFPELWWPLLLLAAPAALAAPYTGITAAPPGVRVDEDPPPPPSLPAPLPPDPPLRALLPDLPPPLALPPAIVMRRAMPLLPELLYKSMPSSSPFLSNESTVCITN